MSRFCLNESLGVLLIRVITGLIFFTHGWAKLGNLAGTEQFFVMLGVPAFMAVVVASLEVVGGIALVLGVATRFFGFVLGVIMLFAIFLTGFERGVSAHEFEAILCAAAFGVALIGSGRFALFPMECRDCGGMMCKPGTSTCKV